MATSPHIWYADGPDAPRSSPSLVLSAAGLESSLDPTVTLGWTLERHPWLDDPDLRARTVLAGYALGRAVNDGRITTLPVRLSAMPRLIASRPPEVAVVTGVRRGDDFTFSRSIGWADALARSADSVVVEVDHEGVDLGGPVIAGNIVATLDRPAAPPAAAQARPADDVDLAIGAFVSAMLPEDATLQFGLGGIGEGIARAIDKPVRLWSGAVTDAMADLHTRGLLLAPIVATYVWGGNPIRELADAGMLRLTSSTETHDISLLSAIPRFVACNTALQVGLDGSVNTERVGRRIIAGIGGHSDFCTGAARSVGGLSVIALRSTSASGSSTIVAEVDRVSTQRSDVDLVVTEHGVADLRGASDPERARRITAIAAPEHRAELQRSAATMPS